MFVFAIRDILTTLMVVGSLAFVAGRVLVVRRGQSAGTSLTSLPVYYGWYCGFGAILPPVLLILLAWLFAVPAHYLVVIVPAVSLVGALFCLYRARPDLNAQRQVEKVIKIALFASGAVAILTTIGIIFSLVFETGRFFSSDGVSVVGFFTGLEWSAQTSAAFGAVPLFFGTFFIAAIAICVAGPIGFFSAIYLSEYASARARRIVKPAIEVLAGIPTVVYGFFAILVVAPVVRMTGEGINSLLRPLTGGIDLISAQPKSALAAGLVMGIMIIPFVSSLSDDVIRSVPKKLKDGALAVGATRAEVMQDIVLPTAFPGLMAAMLLAVSRAIGETMIVVMAAGERANLTLDPFQDVTTVTVQIVALLTGDPEFDSPRTLSAFALGAVLFTLTLAFNAVAQWIVDRQKRRYASV